MQALSPSILRGKTSIAPRDTPRGGGLPLCLSGVSIVTQVPQKKTSRVGSSSRRCSLSSSSRGFNAMRNVRTTATLPRPLGANVLRSLSRDMCERDERAREGSATVPTDRQEDETSRPPRFAVAQEMDEVDRRREAIRQRRSARGLGSFLEVETFLSTRHSRRYQERIRSELRELLLLQSGTSNYCLDNCAARAA
jgi:hypothetical protein